MVSLRKCFFWLQGRCILHTAVTSVLYSLHILFCTGYPNYDVPTCLGTVQLCSNTSSVYANAQLP